MNETVTDERYFDATVALRILMAENKPERGIAFLDELFKRGADVNAAVSEPAQVVLACVLAFFPSAVERRETTPAGEPILEYLRALPLFPIFAALQF